MWRCGIVPIFFSVLTCVTGAPTEYTMRIGFLVGKSFADNSDPQLLKEMLAFTSNIFAQQFDITLQPLLVMHNDTSRPINEPHTADEANIACGTPGDEFKLIDAQTWIQKYTPHDAAAWLYVTWCGEDDDTNERTSMNAFIGTIGRKPIPKSQQSQLNAGAVNVGAVSLRLATKDASQLSKNAVARTIGQLFGLNVTSPMFTTKGDIPQGFTEDSVGHISTKIAELQVKGEKRSSLLLPYDDAWVSSDSSSGDKSTTTTTTTTATTTTTSPSDGSATEKPSTGAPKKLTMSIGFLVGKSFDDNSDAQLLKEMLAFSSNIFSQQFNIALQPLLVMHNDATRPIKEPHADDEANIACGSTGDKPKLIIAQKWIHEYTPSDAAAWLYVTWCGEDGVASEQSSRFSYKGTIGRKPNAKWELNAGAVNVGVVSLRLAAKAASQWSKNAVARTLGQIFGANETSPMFTTKDEILERFTDDNAREISPKIDALRVKGENRSALLLSYDDVWVSSDSSSGDKSTPTTTATITTTSPSEGSTTEKPSTDAASTTSTTSTTSSPTGARGSNASHLTAATWAVVLPLALFIAQHL